MTSNTYPFLESSAFGNNTWTNKYTYNGRNDNASLSLRITRLWLLVWWNWKFLQRYFTNSPVFLEILMIYSVSRMDEVNWLSNFRFLIYWHVHLLDPSIAALQMGLQGNCVFINARVKSGVHLFLFSHGPMPPNQIGHL